VLAAVVTDVVVAGAVVAGAVVVDAGVAGAVEAGAAVLAGTVPVVGGTVTDAADDEQAARAIGTSSATTRAGARPVRARWWRCGTASR
jgi:hypothetical protein